MIQIFHSCCICLLEKLCPTEQSITLSPAVRVQTSLATGAVWSAGTGGDLSWGWSWGQSWERGGCNLEDASRWQASVGHPGRHPQTVKVAEVQTGGDSSHRERCHRSGREGQGKAKEGGFSDVAWSSPAEFSGFPCPSVLGGRVPQRGQRGRPAAARAALPLRLPLLQQWHGAALPGPDAALHQDVPGLSR